jgi:hypothetical protein
MRGTRYRVMAVVLGVLALGAASCGGSPSPSASATVSHGPSPVMVRTYADDEFGFTIRYPDGWIKAESRAPAGSVTPLRMSVVFADPDGAMVDGSLVDGVGVTVYKLDRSTTAAQVRKHPDAFKVVSDEIMAQLDDVTVTTALSPVEVNGAPGFSVVYRHSLNGQQVGAVSYLIPRGRYAYWVTGQATPATWDSAGEELGPSMDSFTLTGG